MIPMLVNAARITFFTLSLGLAACQSPLPSSPSSPTATAGNSAIKLSSGQKQKIARKIWQNESGGTVAGLTAWNAGEEFPSFGIGHFIWYPAGFDGRWEESFPQFIDFARRSGRKDIPTWLLSTRDCPWNSRAAFLADLNGPKLSGMRQFLANSTELQADYIITRSRAALPTILRAARPADRERISRNYQKVASTPHGTYALIDYVNFKGTGTKSTEQYRGEGWGLLQVLSGMQDVPSGQAAAREFANSAKRALSRRIANSPPARGEKRWEAGWHNRCETYARPL